MTLVAGRVISLPRSIGSLLVQSEHPMAGNAG